MNRENVELILSPQEAFDEALFRKTLFDKLNLKDDGNFVVHPLRRSIDARSKVIKVRVQVEILPIEKMIAGSYKTEYRDVSQKQVVIIVGSGPAGLFAALRLLESGIKPVILERGKDVRARRRDIAAINKEHIVNVDSNYCFGEGGAGTYSDGKLYTRSNKRGNVKKILGILIAHGAKDDILFDAHPHIGTNKLPALVEAIRETILRSGGEIHFNTRVNDLIIESGVIKGVITSDHESLQSKAVILATGHSARDIYQLLYNKKVLIEAKPFAMGVRVEHPQILIDQIQYHCLSNRGAYLPASSYALVHQVNLGGRNRGVFSFCMCPGGFIVPSATSPGEVVVNGMSPSRRDSHYANSGIVVAVEESDFKEYGKRGLLAGMYFQSEIEQNACRATGGEQTAPAQRLDDFLNRRVSSSLPATSYQPGLYSMDMKEILPGFIYEGLIQGFRNFGDKMKGYITNEAQIVGVESRTSSPVRIPRNKETLEHPQVKGLFPSGEGAGFAGGIMSAALDGEASATAVVKMYFQ